MPDALSVNAPVPPAGAWPLGTLRRKAATDAGFDLEPERDGAWWRLRASGTPGVAWVRPSDTGGALLALPLLSQLAALDPAPFTRGTIGGLTDADLPPSAAGYVVCPGPERLYAYLRRTWVARTTEPERLRARWDAEVEAALGAFGMPVIDLSGIAADGAAAVAPSVAPLITEAVAQVRRRVGQDLFREALLGLWEGRCAVTGLAVPELLRASHAKPWAVATDTERLDVHNGLLLAVHLDALFDRGLLTFDEEGRGIGSPVMSAEAWATLAMEPGELRVHGLRPQHRAYLAYHRAHVFREG